MAEYIDREKIREEVCKDCTRRIGKDGCMAPEACEDLLTALVAADPADVAPVVHGRWDKCGATRHKTHCTRCGSERPYREIGRGYYLVWDSPYCPACGTKMDGGEKDAEVQA